MFLIYFPVVGRTMDPSGLTNYEYTLSRKNDLDVISLSPPFTSVGL